MITQSERQYLLDSMKKLLTEYNYKYSEAALNAIIDEWSTQKATLIEAFKKHPNYLEGKFMIAFAHDYERTVTKGQSGRFGLWIRSVAMDETFQYLPAEIKLGIPSWARFPPDIRDFFGRLENYAEVTLSESTVNELREIIPEVSVRVGQKTSKVVNKICHYLGYDKAKNYNREFAKYADSLSPMIVKRHTILSINPLDYLTMSFGNSWASCHTIDKENIRDMPNAYHGQYSSGTVSYMLDPSSMVLYTVDASYNGDEYWHEPKINRQMFHWGEDKLVQGRLYPQDNDLEADNVYAPYRNIVQEIMSVIFEFPNFWTLKRGDGAASRYIRSYGTHYRDYENFENCSLSRVKGRVNDNSFQVGARPICVSCGYRHDISWNINCCVVIKCAGCGVAIIDEDEAIEIDGEYYCRGCARYCERCGNWHLGNSTYISDSWEYVCDDCLEAYYTHCDECNSYHSNSDITYVESTDRFVCSRCIRNNYVRCDNCEQYFPRTDTITRANRRGRIGTYCRSCNDELFPPRNFDF